MNKLSKLAVAGGALTAASALIAAGAVGAKSNAKPTSGTVYVAETSRSGPGLLYLAGNIIDKVVGEGAITFTIKPFPNGTTGTITAKAVKVTLWTRKGSLSGTGSALLTITNRPAAGDATVSAGTVSLTNGTGGEKGHSFKATFTGSGSVTTVVYTFHYKGTYS